ncbi:MAG: FxsA family protein [Candidatus Omnitrophica bacterium]|nr:FxsA family protein [Candidatus Omnitrophota bacterium]
MGCLIALLILAFPAAEIYVLIKVGSWLGFWDTLFLLIFSAMFGVYLARWQGAITLRRIQACLAEGKAPTVEMVDGLLLFAGGILFMIPGFLSDILGVFFVFPLTRWLFRWLILRKIGADLSRRASHPGEAVQANRMPPPAAGRGRVEDAEIVE